MDHLLHVNDLHVSFDTDEGEVQAVRGVSFHLDKGETLAIVGESGSGKSVMTKALLRLLPAPPAKFKQGSVLFKGKNLLAESERGMRKIRGREIAMIFQDPMTSLNPTMTIKKQVMEGIVKQNKKNKRRANFEVISLLERVGISNAKAINNHYPHQLSGGMRQRVAIAIALVLNPQVIIADEPTTALDPTVQAQILDLLKTIQKTDGTAFIFITHDLGVVANIADRVAVMYAGKIVEIGTAGDIFYNPQHPYTWALLSSLPSSERKGDELPTISGRPPNMVNPPQGDAFFARNPYALEIDRHLEPPLFQLSDTHFAATWLLHENASIVRPRKHVKMGESSNVKRSVGTD